MAKRWVIQIKLKKKIWRLFFCSNFFCSTILSMGTEWEDYSSIMLSGYMPLTCSANRNGIGKGAAGASRLQPSAHRGEGRVPGLAYIFSKAQAQASTQAQTRLHSFHAQKLSGFIHFQDLLWRKTQGVAQRPADPTLPFSLFTGHQQSHKHLNQNSSFVWHESILRTWIHPTQMSKSISLGTVKYKIYYPRRPQKASSKPLCQGRQKLWELCCLS